MCGAKNIEELSFEGEIELDNKIVLVVFIKLYSMTWYWRGSTPRIDSFK
jgi:hypothetical protein